ncbi:MAG: class A beta-lactamase [Chakrabartia sp.]
MTSAAANPVRLTIGVGLLTLACIAPAELPASAEAASIQKSSSSKNDKASGAPMTLKLRSTGHSISIMLPPTSPEPTINDSARAAPVELTTALRTLWSAFPGKAGIAVMKGDGSWLVSYRGDEPMPQQSVSKLWVSIAVMDAVDKGQLRLEDKVTLRKSDMTLFHQPIASLIGPDGYTTTIGALLRRAMTQSDNTANDFLMRRVGGPSAIRDVIASKRLGAIRVGPGDRHFQAATAGMTWRPEYSSGWAFQTARASLPLSVRKSAMDKYVADPMDGATPAAIARSLARLKRGELLSAQSTRYLLGVMEQTTTGRSRLKAGVPAGWKLAHKTGTGQDLQSRTAGFNDVGIMTAPDGTSYTVAVMIADTKAPIGYRQRLIQQVAATVAASHRASQYASRTSGTSAGAN